MAASDHLGQQFMYHHSPARNRDSIRSQGLQPHNPYDPYYHEDESEAPTGVYLGPHHEVSPLASHGSDIWRVHTVGLNLRQDPDDGNGEYGFRYSPDPIGPERLKLAKKAQQRPQPGLTSL